MTKYKKVIFLFLALMLPVCIFLFLKIFGKNEFAVPPLFTEALPENINECGVAVALPYRVPERIRDSLSLPKQKMSLIHFGPLESNDETNLRRVKDNDANKFDLIALPDSLSRLKRCVFFLTGDNDLVLVDNQGIIRGQYKSSERGEIDRLQMELSILFKEY
jgi:hypothetical protein